MQRQFLISQSAEQRAKLAALERQQAQKEAERATIAATIAKLEATMPMIQERVDIRKTCSTRNWVRSCIYLAELAAAGRASSRSSLVQKSRCAKLTRPCRAQETRAQAAAEYRRRLFDELAKAEQKGDGSAQDLVKAEQRTKLQR